MLPDKFLSVTDGSCEAGALAVLKLTKECPATYGSASRCLGSSRKPSPGNPAAEILVEGSRASSRRVAAKVFGQPSLGALPQYDTHLRRGIACKLAALPKNCKE